MPKSGIKKANSASDGSVCTSPASVRAITANVRDRAANTPSGTPNKMAMKRDMPTSRRCWATLWPISMTARPVELGWDDGGATQPGDQGMRSFVGGVLLRDDRRVGAHHRPFVELALESLHGCEGLRCARR